MNRTLVAAVIAALVAGFGGGYLAARGFEGRAGAHGPLTPGASIWAMFGKPRSADAPRRGIPKPEGFAVWRTRLDTSGGAPLACVQFSRPLDPATSYSDYVLVFPELGHTPAVSARNDELCVGGVGFTDRRITLLKGLPSKSGEKLAENSDQDFIFGEKPPYVGFAGTGVILPREESDGVGIETINVTKVKIEVWRVADRNLVRKSISAPNPTNEGDYAEDYGEDSPDEDGRIVWKGVMDIKGDAGSKVTTVFPLGATLKEMKPGGYVIKVRDASGGRDLQTEGGEGTPPAQARRWIMFTDMAVMSYSGQDGLDVVVRSLKTARTLAGVSVSLVAKDGEDLGVAKTDASGRASFAHSMMEGEGAAGRPGGAGPGPLAGGSVQTGRRRAKPRRRRRRHDRRAHHAYGDRRLPVLRPRHLSPGRDGAPGLHDPRPGRQGGEGPQGLCLGQAALGGGIQALRLHRRPDRSSDQRCGPAQERAARTLDGGAARGGLQGGVRQSVVLGGGLRAAAPGGDRRGAQGCAAEGR